MAVTKRNFQGQAEQRNVQDFLKSTEGAEAMQSSVAKGGSYGLRQPGHDPIDPRRLFSTHIGNERLGVIPSGSELHHNEASTGRHQPEKKLISGERAPRTTGAGEGQRIFNTYRPVTQGVPPGSTASSDALVDWADRLAAVGAVGGLR